VIGQQQPLTASPLERAPGRFLELVISMPWSIFESIFSLRLGYLYPIEVGRGIMDSGGVNGI